MCVRLHACMNVCTYVCMYSMHVTTKSQTILYFSHRSGFGQLVLPKRNMLWSIRSVRVETRHLQLGLAHVSFIEALVLKYCMNYVISYFKIKRTVLWVDYGVMTYIHTHSYTHIYILRNVHERGPPAEKTFLPPTALVYCQMDRNVACLTCYRLPT